MNEAADEALRRARAHLHAATLEGLEAARALLEVAIQGAGLGDATEDSLIGGLERSLDQLIGGIRANTPFVLPTVLAEPLAVALEAEIERWQTRSRTDPDARPVLRAFLGLRELLWEIGVDRAPGSTKPDAGREAGRPDPSRARRARVQRFDVED